MTHAEFKKLVEEKEKEYLNFYNKLKQENKRYSFKDFTYEYESLLEQILESNNIFSYELSGDPVEDRKKIDEFLNKIKEIQKSEKIIIEKTETNDYEAEAEEIVTINEFYYIYTYYVLKEEDAVLKAIKKEAVKYIFYKELDVSSWNFNCAIAQSVIEGKIEPDFAAELMKGECKI